MIAWVPAVKFSGGRPKSANVGTREYVTEDEVRVPVSGTDSGLACYVRAMVRLVYTCPETGVVIVGGHFSEQAVMQAYHSATVIKCPACRQEHHPQVRECRIFRAASPHLLLVPLQAS